MCHILQKPTCDCCQGWEPGIHCSKNLPHFLILDLLLLPLFLRGWRHCFQNLLTPPPPLLPLPSYLDSRLIEHF